MTFICIFLGSAIIPRSSKSSHLEENLNVYNFTLTNDEMVSLGWPYVAKGDEL